MTDTASNGGRIPTALVQVTLEAQAEALTVATRAYRAFAPNADPRIVIFDLGEVLVTPSRLMADLAARAGSDATSFEAAYWTRRLEYDLGLDHVEYWANVLQSLGTQVTKPMIDDLTRIDTSAWTTIRPDAAQLLKQLHGSGMRLGILSNATVEMVYAAQESDWAPWVSDWFFSTELGIAKPNPAIYQHVTKVLGMDPDAILYVEDSPASVSAAHAEGWNAYLWRSGADTAAHLAALVTPIRDAR